jgi:hypothetical protein
VNSYYISDPDDTVFGFHIGDRADEVDHILKSFGYKPYEPDEIGDYKKGKATTHGPEFAVP